MTVAEWVTLIGAVTAAIVTVIDAVRTSGKLTSIAKDTNGTFSTVKTELAMVRSQLNNVRR